MKLQDIKTLITSGTIILAVGLYFIFAPNKEESNQIDYQVNIEAKEHNLKTYDISEFEKYELIQVIDGDTIRIRYNNKEELVRLLLVDAPEINHKTLGKQPYGPEAKEYLSSLLKNDDKIVLEFDETNRDKYDRLLGYAYTEEGISLQDALLRSGFVRVGYVYEPNTKHLYWFEEAQGVAKANYLNIWSVEGYVTNKGFKKEVYYEKVGESSKEETNSTNACLIKGNINSKGDKIYHSPGQENYENTVAEEMFCTENDALEAGFRAASR